MPERYLESKREMAVRLAWKMIGIPYVWGGDDPIKGFDCSGMCIEILKSVGILPRKGDWTASGLYNRFQENEIEQHQIGPGCLIFWRPDVHITHVEFALTDELSVGASGGGRYTLTWKNAVTQNAYIKIRPWDTRGGEKLFVDPFLQ